MAEIKTTDLYCLDCKYYSSKDRSCDFYLRTKVRRGCPAGTGCTRFEEGERFRANPAPHLGLENSMPAWIRRLYYEGFTDVQIGKRLGLSVDVVYNWRSKLCLPSRVEIRKESESDWI